MSRQKPSTKPRRRAADKLDPLVRLSSVLRVIDTEEECDGPPSPACIAAFRAIMESKQDEAFAEAIRCAVRATKKSLHERVRRLANNENRGVCPKEKP